MDSGVEFRSQLATKALSLSSLGLRLLICEERGGQFLWVTVNGCVNVPAGGSAEGSPPSSFHWLFVPQVVLALSSWMDEHCGRAPPTPRPPQPQETRDTAQPHPSLRP